MDTIFALASARGKAGIAVVRVSGPSALAVAQNLCGALPEPRRAGLRPIILNGELLDQGLVLVFERGRSFTDEDVVEFHLHGSPAVVSALLRFLGDTPGLRLADPGEFSRRALENGCLDLAQIEGLGDLIDAETDAQRRQALRLFSGDLGKRVEDWRCRLIQISGLVAAMIDFADEEIPDNLVVHVGDVVDGLVAALKKEAAGFAMSERIREGFEVAIIGAPNSGKSTLLNTIVGRRAALTSPVAGTTRDVIEVRLDLGGLAVTLLDTAGLRESDDEIEALGIQVAKERAEMADLRIFLVESEENSLGVGVKPGDLIVGAKADLAPGSGLRVSGLTGEGVDVLMARIADVLGDRAEGAALITRERHRRAVEDAVLSLDRVQAEMSGGALRPELIGEDLRAAAQALDVLIGKVDVEDILGEVFSRFCVGK